MPPRTDESRPFAARLTLPILLLTAEAALHAGYVLHHRVNSDEPQHLHVAWSMAQGLLQYRDVFDNHSPLFSMMLAPLIGSFGERADIFLLARLAMIPLTLLTLALTWVLARSLFSAREALWAVVIAAAVPDFMLGSVEYRTDQLWMLLWIAAMAVLLAGRLTRGRSFAFGLVAGAALSSSMKTALLLFSLCVVVVVVLVSARRRGVPLDLRGLAARAAAALGGFAVVPGLLAAYFAARGAWDPMVYCVVGHNMVANLRTLLPPTLRMLILGAGFPIVWLVGDRILHSASDRALGVRRGFLFMLACGYFVLLHGAWPLLTRQDVLPFVPMAAVLAAPFLLRVPSRLVPAVVIALMLLWCQKVERVDRENDTLRDTAFLREVLRFTRPGEPIMDLRGETIFRPRPFYYALEAVTEARLSGGQIRDDIPERLVATRTAVAVADVPGFPERGRAFLNENYISFGRLRAVGRMLAAPDSAGWRRFEIRVPQRYAMVGEKGSVSGWLDGTPYRGPRELGSGPHAYRGPASEGRIAVVWAPAVERAGSPFR